MRLTADLARESPAYINPLRQRELSLRGFKIPTIENLGATQDQYQVIDFSDNEILKIDNFPMMLKLEGLLFADNRICRVARGLGKYLPKLESLVLTNNKFSKLNDLRPLSEFPLTFLCLLGNPVSKLPDYRLFVIYRLPLLKVLDFQKVKDSERKAAEAKFGKLNYADEKDEEEAPSEAGAPAAVAAAAATEGTLTQEERAAIMEKIKTATSLAEVEQYEKQLKGPTQVHVEDMEDSEEEPELT